MGKDIIYNRSDPTLLITWSLSYMKVLLIIYLLVALSGVLASTPGSSDYWIELAAALLWPLTLVLIGIKFLLDL